MTKPKNEIEHATGILRCDTDSAESTDSTVESLSPPVIARDDLTVPTGNAENDARADRIDRSTRRTMRRIVDDESDNENNRKLLKNYMVAPSTSEERQNERYARKVGINFSLSRGDYLTLFSGLSDDASASIATDGTEEATLSPQYGKKDDHFTFREMYGDVNQILEPTPKSKQNEVPPAVFRPEKELITPRTRTAMIDHDQVIDTLRERAAILSVDWAKKEYMAPSLARRLRDFEFAQKKRRKKFGAARKFGILSLYDFLTAVREDVEWAEDAAFRRSNCLPYVRWCDFVESKNGATNRPYFACGILLICTISLIISIGINDWAFESMSINPSFGPSAETLLHMGAKDSNLIVNSYQVWRLLTPMFLHGGLIHFGLNCFAMFYIGRAVEHNHGFTSTAILFTVPSIGSTIISAIFLPQFISVGASGGIFGLIGGLTTDIFRNRKLIFSDFINKGRSRRHHVLVLLVLVMDIFVNLLLGLTPYTDNFMHLGGFFLGCLCASTIINPVDLFGYQSTSIRTNRRNIAAFFSRHFGPMITGLTIIVSLVILFQGDGITSPCPSCRYLSCVSFPPWTDYDKRWYYCDDCGRVLAFGRRDKSTGEYASIEMHCPAGNTIFFSVDGYDNDKESLQKNLPSFCREKCLN